ncbi:MAG: hypothetical protein ACYS17_01995 [Planctomycetota bacterium]
MVKKSLIALAVAALMVTTVQAGDPAIKRDGDWPFTYKAIDLCKIPVFMDIGHFVQLKDCNKREIKMVQVDCASIGKNGGDFPCYSDCENIEVRANFPAIFGASLTKIGSVLQDTSVYWKDGINQISGSTGDWEKLTICLDAWKAEIWRAALPTQNAKVGELIINVKPPDGP